MKKAAVFIDGNNFYHRMKGLCEEAGQKLPLLEFDYKNFFQWLCKPHRVVEIRYYVGAIRRNAGDQKSERLYADQQRLLARLNQQEITHVLGTLIRHPDDTLHEKGVDVRLAIEMIRSAHHDVYDIAYLVSSDTDLVAAVEEVRSFKKEACYVGTAKGQSFGLTKAANDTRLIRFEDIRPYFPATLLHG